MNCEQARDKLMDLVYEELPAGEIGELIVEGPMVTRQYVTRVGANALAKIADRGKNQLPGIPNIPAVKEFSEPAACIVKHTTPCGCAVAADLATAFFAARRPPTDLSS